MLITKEIEIDLGHRVTNHKSKCSSLHGHRYKIQAGVNDKIITTMGVSDEGMVIDFGDLKKVMMKIIDEPYDHGFVLWEEDPLCDVLERDAKTKFTALPFIPTAENLAEFWGRNLYIELKRKKIHLEHLIVWETPTSTAKWTSEGKNDLVVPRKGMKLTSTSER